MNKPFKLGLMKKVSSLRTKDDFSAFIVYNLSKLSRLECRENGSDASQRLTSFSSFHPHLAENFGFINATRTLARPFAGSLGVSESFPVKPKQEEERKIIEM